MEVPDATIGDGIDPDDIERTRVYDPVLCLMYGETPYHETVDVGPDYDYYEVDPERHVEVVRSPQSADVLVMIAEANGAHHKDVHREENVLPSNPYKFSLREFPDGITVHVLDKRDAEDREVIAEGNLRLAMESQAEVLDEIESSALRMYRQTDDKKIGWGGYVDHARQLLRMDPDHRRTSVAVETSTHYDVRTVRFQDQQPGDRTRFRASIEVPHARAHTMVEEMSLSRLVETPNTTSVTDMTTRLDVIYGKGVDMETVAEHNRVVAGQLRRLSDLAAAKLDDADDDGE